MTTEEFISIAMSIHGDKYDYSKTEYIDSRKKVVVICPVHGEFAVMPYVHLSGCICRKCHFETKKRIIHGAGVNDLIYESNSQAYRIWKHVLMRCLDEKFKDIHTSYKDCSIFNEWLVFSNFKRWFDEHYIEGWELDKDVIIKGNKLYSPQTCCFIPHEINGLFAKSDKKRGEYPIGVTKHGSGFRALLTINGKKLRLGTFKTAIEAFLEYKKNKELAIKNIADKYKDELEPRVYKALYNYKVEITD